MPKEYDSVISEELADISKGLRKRHRTGVSGTASTEMMQLRNRTDELAVPLEAAMRRTAKRNSRMPIRQVSTMR